MICYLLFHEYMGHKSLRKSLSQGSDKIAKFYMHIGLHAYREEMK